jgi:hypothetical protein
VSRGIRFVQSHCLYIDLRGTVAEDIGAVCGVYLMHCCIWCIDEIVLDSFWCGPAVGIGPETKFERNVHQLCSLRL